jgi:hypothetical protein
MHGRLVESVPAWPNQGFENKVNRARADVTTLPGVRRKLAASQRSARNRAVDRLVNEKAQEKRIPWAG